MPPKSKVATNGESAENGEGGDSTFRWTAENDHALLILTLGRTVGPDDYHKLVEALPSGANYNGVRLRVSKYRMEQRKRFEEMGWEVSESTKAPAAARKKGPATPRKKRNAKELSGEVDEMETPKKKPNLKKVKKVKQEQEEMYMDMEMDEFEVSVKEEKSKEEAVKEDEED